MEIDRYGNGKRSRDASAGRKGRYEGSLSSSADAFTTPGGMRPCSPGLLLSLLLSSLTEAATPWAGSETAAAEQAFGRATHAGFPSASEDSGPGWSDRETDSPRIIGGYVMAPHSSKYLVSLKRKTGFHFCGGALVSRSWVLTAAHCKTGLNQMLVVAGEYSLSTFEGTEQIFRPARMVVHPHYSAPSKNADIMLIKLSRPVAYSPFVSIVPVPRQGATVRAGRLCRVSGWGYTTPVGGRTSDTLRSVYLPLVSTCECNSSASYAGYITKNMICAGFGSGGKDACQGDSGGPLVCDGRVFGIVSWGHSCASPGYPGVYTAVANFQKWIYKMIFKK
ncbi:trypsin-3-like [Liasis olivaceus]